MRWLVPALVLLLALLVPAVALLLLLLLAPLPWSGGSET
jgi:hypothetical protein